MRTLRLGFVVLSLACWGCGDGASSSEADGGGDQTVDTADSAPFDTAEPTDSAVSDLSPDGASSDGGADGGGADGSGEPDAGPELACTTLVPTAGYNGAAVALTIDGQLFEQTATVTLHNLVTSEALALADPTITDSNENPGLDQITAAVAAGVVEGTYAVVVQNPGSGESVDCGTYVSTAQRPPTVTDVAPDTAWEGDTSDAVLSDQPVSITGTGFSPTPAVRFINETSRAVFNATSVAWVSPTSLTAVCPSESQQMPVGAYLVEVVNPSRLSGSWKLGDGSAGIFSVTATPPPRIDDVSPIKALVSAGGGKPVDDVTITGDFFQQETKLFLLRRGEAPQDISASVTSRTIEPAGADQIVFPFDVNALGLQVGIYPLRLVNPDGQFDTFFSLQVENSAEGKLNAGQWETSSLLVNPRDKHDAVFGFDVFGNGYLFVVGGTSLPLGGDLASRPRPLLGDTEVIQVDNFGDPIAQSIVVQQLRPGVDLSQVNPRTGLETGGGAAPLRATNELLTPRSGLTVVRAGAQLYAIGGVAEDSWDPAKTGQITALDTVERATVLGYESMPNLSLPRVLRASRGLPRGSWFYRVAAVRGELGESLPSREVVAQDAGGHISLKWLPVEGATSYLVYRSPASDGRAGSARLLAANVTGTSFVDDGLGALTPAPGRLAGALQSGGALAAGDWTYRVTAVLEATGETLASYPVTLRVAADGAEKTIALKWDPIVGATYNVYRSANPGEQAAALLVSGLDSNSHADAGDPLEAPETTAPDGIAPLPPGSLSRWQLLDAKLTVGREGAQGVVVKAYDGDDRTRDEPSYVFVVGGRAGNSTGAASLDTTDRAQILTDGTLGPFALASTDAGATVALNTPRAFFGLVTTQGRKVTPVAPPPDVPPCPDDDGDGHQSCVCGGDDCNDGAAGVYPGAEEICGDGIDQNCDQGCAGGQDEACPDPCLADGGDGDGDGFKREACGGEDCNDGDDTVCPDSQKCPEICGDTIDQDCVGGDQACDACDADGGDADGDGFKREACGGNDCNDDSPTICPDRTQCPEVMCDGIDQDCDDYQPCLYFNDPGAASAGEDPRAQVWGYDPRLKQSTRYFPPATQPLANGDEEEAPVYLGAIFGAQSFPATAARVGAGDAEVTLVTKQGNLTAWTTQADKPNNQPIFGNDALLYSSFCYSFLGAQTEGGPGTDPSGIVNQVFYWMVDEAAIADWSDPVPATILQKPATSFSSGSPVPAGRPELQQLPRAFFSAVRLSAFVFGVAGNGGAGTGPLKSVIQIKQ